MAQSSIHDALQHHVWATLALIDACAPLGDDALASPVPGAYGSILATLNHLVFADARYLSALSGGGGAPTEPPGDEFAGLADLRGEMAGHATPWANQTRKHRDPDQVIRVPRQSGGFYEATVGIRLAQAVHHGTDHRSQVCTALTGLGATPPEIDVWDYGEAIGAGRAVP